ncbi:MAG: M48 family metalloprotease [Myxococcales bacterium]
MTIRRLPIGTLVAAVALLLPAAALAVDEQVLRYFTAEQIARHDEYVRPLYWLWAIKQVWWLVFTLLFLLLQLNRRLKAGCDRLAARVAGPLAKVGVLRRIGLALTKLWGDASWGGAMAFVAAYLAIVTLIDLPTDFYFGWVRERQHGLSVESFGRWSWDSTKGFVISVATFSALAFGLYGLARRRRNWWLLLGAPCAVLLLGAGLLDPYRVQIYRDYEPLPDGPARRAILRTLEKAGVEHEGVFQLKMRDTTRRVNAFIAGQGPTRRIVVWDTFIAAMTPDEVANAVGHELGHLRDRSPGRLVLASLCLVPYLWLIAVALRRLGRRGRLGFDGDRDVASLPAVLLLVWFVTTALKPIGGAYGRYLEHRADRYALELLEQPESFRSMMVKLASLNRADLHPPAWVVLLLATHPPTLERIERAERFARERGIAMAEPSPALFGVPEPEEPAAETKRAEPTAFEPAPPALTPPPP